MNQPIQSPAPEKMKEKECAILEDQRLSAIQILSAQEEEARENEEHTLLFVP